MEKREEMRYEEFCGVVQACMKKAKKQMGTIVIEGKDLGGNEHHYYCLYNSGNNTWTIVDYDSHLPVKGFMKDNELVEELWHLWKDDEIDVFFVQSISQINDRKNVKEKSEKESKKRNRRAFLFHR